MAFPLFGQTHRGKFISHCDSVHRNIKIYINLFNQNQSFMKQYFLYEMHAYFYYCCYSLIYFIKNKQTNKQKNWLYQLH